MSTPDTDWIAALCAADTDPNRAVLDGADFDLAGVRAQLDSYTRTDLGDGNVAWCHPDARLPKISFLLGGSGNIIVWGAQMQSRQPVVVNGHGNRIIVGPPRRFNARIGVTGDNNLFFSGKGSTCNEANCVLQGTGRSILMGKDCMLSFDVALRATDSHAIVDLDALAVINEPDSILLGAHVWLGEGASVLKGVRIGRGSILASRGLAVSDLPARVLAVGAPAKVQRQNVSWTRQPDPDQEAIEALARRYPD